VQPSTTSTRLRTPYMILSYVWGESQLNHTIALDGRPFLIHRNLRPRNSNIRTFGSIKHASINLVLLNIAVKSLSWTRSSPTHGRRLSD
jgi:hypothetical protein